MTNELDIERRRRLEVQAIASHGFMSLREISQVIGASDSTVRRDLDALQENGILRRTRGGAVILKDGPGQSATGLAGPASAEKLAIANAAAELMPPGQTLILNGGTTCLAVARALRGRRVNVVTNSPAIAAMLCTDLATEVTLLGGYVYPRIGVAVGTTAAQQLESLHAAKFVTSCAGLTTDGVFEANQMLADVERRMMAKADEAILVADHSKLGLRAVVKLCDLGEIDVIVTDGGAGEESRRWLSSLGIRIVYADETGRPQATGD